MVRGRRPFTRLNTSLGPGLWEDKREIQSAQPAPEATLKSSRAASAHTHCTCTGTDRPKLDPSLTTQQLPFAAEGQGLLAADSELSPAQLTPVALHPGKAE